MNSCREHDRLASGYRKKGFKRISSTGISAKGQISSLSYLFSLAPRRGHTKANLFMAPALLTIPYGPSDGRSVDLQESQLSDFPAFLPPSAGSPTDLDFSHAARGPERPFM